MSTVNTQQHKRVILVDDDPIANMISIKIIQRNFAGGVVAFANAQEALEQITAWWSHEGPAEPVVIFLDINMPHMDGWEFLNEFEKLPGAVRDKIIVAMLTSSIDVDDIEKSKTYRSVKEFISKPLTQDKLSILHQLKCCCDS